MKLEDCQVRVMRMVVAEGAVLDDGDGVDLVDGGRRLVEGAGVDVPGVVLLWGVFEGLELVAAGVAGRGYSELASSSIEAGDAAGACDR